MAKKLLFSALSVVIALGLMLPLFGGVSFAKEGTKTEGLEIIESDKGTLEDMGDGKLKVVPKDGYVASIVDVQHEKDGEVVVEPVKVKDGFVQVEPHSIVTPHFIRKGASVLDGMRFVDNPTKDKIDTREFPDEFQQNDEYVEIGLDYLLEPVEGVVKDADIKPQTRDSLIVKRGGEFKFKVKDRYTAEDVHYIADSNERRDLESTDGMYSLKVEEPLRIFADGTTDKEWKNPVEMGNTSFFLPAPSRVYLTKQGKVRYGRYSTNVFHLSNEYGSTMAAFCIDPAKSTPGNGYYGTSRFTGSEYWYEQTRAIMWYASYVVNRSGNSTDADAILPPYDWYKKPWDNDTRLAFYHMLLSANNIGYHAAIHGVRDQTIIDFYDKWHDWVRIRANEKLADGSIPSRDSFDIFVVDTGADNQPILGYSYVRGGYLTVQKRSDLPNITNGNRCYTLQGANFDIIKQSNGAKIGTLTTNAQGYAKYPNMLEQGNYILRETDPSTGYTLPTRNEMRVTVSTSNTSGSPATVSVTQQALNDPAAIEISKIFSEYDKANKPFMHERLPLTGTEFTIKYYDGYYTAANLPSTPTRTWKLGVQPYGNGSYSAALDNDHLLAGSDAFYRDNKGNATIPLGTISIQETKPAFGYTLDGFLEDKNGHRVSTRQPLVVQCVKNGNIAYFNAGNYAFESSNESVRGSFKIVKKDGSGKLLVGARFEMKNSRGELIAVKDTNASGELVFDNLYPDEYVVTELGTNAGYTLLKEPLRISIPARFSAAEVEGNVANLDRLKLSPHDNKHYAWDTTMQVTNEKSFIVPMTGAETDYRLLIAASLVAVLAAGGGILALKKN